MSASPNLVQCEQADLLSVHALRAIPADEVPEVEAHLAACGDCRDRLEALHRIVAAFSLWPKDVFQPSATLRERLAQRIAAQSAAQPASPSQPQWSEPAWEQVAPGISCKLFATDTENDRVSMLVTLEPGVEYPPHTHAGCEELHLLDGELWINDTKLQPGDYNRAEGGTADKRVWSETGCTCILITSTRDTLGSG